MEFCLYGTNDVHDKIVVRVKEASDLNFTRFDGENLTMYVSIDAGCFHVENYPIYGRAFEQLSIFKHELERCYQTLTGTAEFRSDKYDEDGLQFKLTMESKGHAHIDGSIIGIHPQDSSISFQLETNQSAFPEALSGLRAILVTLKQRKKNDSSSKTDLQVANKELLSMIKDKKFNEERARELLDTIPDIDVAIANENGYESTYLNEAAEYNNLRMVKLLFEYGADPNYFGKGGEPCPFWELQYCVDDEDDEMRLSIVELFLEYGAEPLLAPEGVPLYEWALDCSHEYDDHNDREGLYRDKFCDLLFDYIHGNRPSLLYQIRLPEKEHIETYNMEELKQYLSRWMVGHTIDGIFHEFDSSFSRIREPSYTDADDWLGHSVILMLDQGFLEFSPWVGETIKLRFFSKEDVFFAEIGDDLYSTNHRYMYYRTYGMVTNEIVNHSIESISIRQAAPTAVAFRIDNGKDILFITDEAEDCYFIVAELYG